MVERAERHVEQGPPVETREVERLRPRVGIDGAADVSEVRIVAPATRFSTAASFLTVQSPDRAHSFRRQRVGGSYMRDLSRAERVWQVGGGEFGPLQSLDTARTNLPLQQSSFVGRESQR